MPTRTPHQNRQVKAGRFARTKPAPAKSQSPLGALTALLPTGGKATPAAKRGRGKSAGGMAAFAAVAGLALKNRDKLMGSRKPGQPPRS